MIFLSIGHPWLYHGERAGAYRDSAGYPSTLDIFESFEFIPRDTSSAPEMALYVPSDWKVRWLNHLAYLEVNHFIYIYIQHSERFPFPLLRPYLDYMADHRQRCALVEFKPRSHFADQPVESMMPNVSRWELDGSCHSIEWTLLKILLRGEGDRSTNPLERDGAWRFGSIIHDMCLQMQVCDLTRSVVNSSNNWVYEVITDTTI